VSLLSLPELFADGPLLIEDADPCRRLIFCAQRCEPDGSRFHVPVASIVVPAHLLDGYGRRLVAAALLVPEMIGAPQGRG